MLSKFKNLKDKNLIKLSKDENNWLRNRIQEISIKYSKDRSNFLFWLDKDIAAKKKIFESKALLDEETKYFKEKILKSKNRNSLSCRKLAATYFEETRNKIGKTKVNKILRENLGLHYLKTTCKSNITKTKQSIIHSMVFIKTLIKCLSMGFEPLFIDESALESSNNNYHCWRGLKE